MVRVRRKGCCQADECAWLGGRRALTAGQELLRARCRPHAGAAPRGIPACRVRHVCVPSLCASPSPTHRPRRRAWPEHVPAVAAGAAPAASRLPQRARARRRAARPPAARWPSAAPPAPPAARWRSLLRPLWRPHGGWLARHCDLKDAELSRHSRLARCTTSQFPHRVKGGSSDPNRAPVTGNCAPVRATAPRTTRRSARGSSSRRPQG